MIENINPAFGDAVRFDSVHEMGEAIRELDRLNPGEGYTIPADGPREGRDYVDVSRAASALGSIRTAKKAAASRENGKKGGRPAAVLPAAVHLGAGYIITRTGKLQRGGYAISLSEAHRAVILSAHTAGDARTALVKAKRYWNGMKHDPELTADEARGL